MNQPNVPKPLEDQPEHVRSIPLDLIITVLTCGLFNLYVQYRQIKAVNDMIKEEKFSFAAWFVLCFFTCGLYHIYHEFRVSEELARALQDPHSQEPLISLLLTMFGLHIVADAIQQSRINKFYGDNSL